MKTTRIHTIAMTMVMAISSGLQASVTEHQPPAPLPEFKTPEQLAKWRTETTSKTSAQEASRLSTLESSTPFYTGKPYLAESGSYAFKYREYNPKMGRWTTVDPSGFPDGANNRVYAAVPTSEFDNNGLEINSVSDAIVWFNTAKGENATLGSSIISGFRETFDYIFFISFDALPIINDKLKAVDKNSSSGTVSGSGYRGFNYGSVLGSFALNISYNSKWTASVWVNKKRTVTSNVTLQLWINDRYDFTPNASYSDFKNLYTEDIPGWIAEYSYPGQGTPYWMQANFSDNVLGSALQKE